MRVMTTPEVSMQACFGRTCCRDSALLLIKSSRCSLLGCANKERDEEDSKDSIGTGVLVCMLQESNQIKSNLFAQIYHINIGIAANQSMSRANKAGNSANSDPKTVG